MSRSIDSISSKISASCSAIEFDKSNTPQVTLEYSLKFEFSRSLSRAKAKTLTFGLAANISTTDFPIPLLAPTTTTVLFIITDG